MAPLDCIVAGLEVLWLLGGSVWLGWHSFGGAQGKLQDVSASPPNKSGSIHCTDASWDSANAMEACQRTVRKLVGLLSA